MLQSERDASPSFFNRYQKDTDDDRSYPRTVDQLSKLSSKERNMAIWASARDLKRSRPSTFQRSELYSWLTLTVGVFYGIPALQLVLNHNFRQQDSGDQDLCYYNFLCAVPAGIFANFNNIFSNVYYLIFGTLFLILVWFRRRQQVR